MSAGRLENQVVLIVGGTTGLGLSAARALVGEGARLVVTGPELETLNHAVTTLGGATVGVHGDARDPKSADLAVSRTVEAFGRIDSLYHVAGGSGRRFGDGPLDQITDDGWVQTLDLNLNSVFYSNRAAVRQFLAQGRGGAIVNLASVLASSPSPEFFSTHAYATAKAGIIALSRAAASRYAIDNIRVNVVAPGLVETPMSARAVHDAKIMKFIESKQPLDGGRIGRCDDVDAAVVFLLSRESRFITGQVLAVDGGWGLTEGRTPE